VPRPRHVGQRHLMRTPGTLGFLTVHLLGAGPALGAAQDDHGPAGALRGAVGAGAAWMFWISVITGVQRLGHLPVHGLRFVALDEVGRVAVAAKQRFQFLVADAGQHGGVGDLVSVKVQDRQDGPVGRGVEELIGVPAGGQRAGLGLAVADDAGDDQVGVVEGGAEGVAERVAEFTALVDRAGRLRGDVAGDAAGERKLLEQPSYALLILADVRVDLAIDALQVDVGHHAGAAVAGAADVEHVQVVCLDDAVEVDVDEVQAGRRAPMSEQPGFDVFEL